AWCEVVETTEEALALLSRFTPQVVLADHRLRGAHNGRQVLEMIRARIGHAVPGVVITGDTAADRLREAQASGAVLLHEPVPAGQLHEVLSGLLCPEPDPGAGPLSGPGAEVAAPGPGVSASAAG